MTVALDTFLVTVYTRIADLYQQHCASQKPPRPGPAPVRSDSEVLTQTRCAQWHGRSERRFRRSLWPAWRGDFPHLLRQSAVNRRVRDRQGARVQRGPLLAAQVPAEIATSHARHTVALPLARRCRGRRRKLFDDEAGGGRRARWQCPRGVLRRPLVGRRPRRWSADRLGAGASQYERPLVGGRLLLLAP